MKKNLSFKRTEGFTIVELMIALSVLSVLLVIATVVLIRIGALYSKGVNTANLQNTTRNVADDITASLQFSGQSPSPLCIHGVNADNVYGCGIGSATRDVSFPVDGGTARTEHVYAICFGPTRYTYVIGPELGQDIHGLKAAHILWRDTMKNSNSCDPLDLSVLDPDGPADHPIGNSTGNGYEMAPEHTRLTRFSVYETESNSNVFDIKVWMAYGDSDLLNVNPDGSANCRGGTGQQFCAISALTTSATERITPN